jgi:pSer/pThr/pTyr-binding forkhead associated (FHA) protein
MVQGEQSGCAAVPFVAESAPALRLVIQKGSQKGTRLSCRHWVTLIGSRAGCKIRLPHERVSPVHAALINDGKKITAVDLLSTTGSLLNGLKLEHEQVSDGDRLEIGPWDFIVEISAPPKNGSHNGAVVDLEPAPNVVALEHVDTGRVLQPNRDVCLVGRKNGCDIVISDPDVSRVHGLLMSFNDRPAILDLVSRNGTLVNDQLVHFQMLKDGDVVTIGESIFRVRILGSAVAERAAKKEVRKAAAPAEDSDTELAALAMIESEPDLVSIESVESAQRWRIADDLAKVEKASRA